MSTLSHIAPPGSYLSATQARELISQACPAKDYKDKRVLLIVPDATRTCPLGMLFQAMFEQIGGAEPAVHVRIGRRTQHGKGRDGCCPGPRSEQQARRPHRARARSYNRQ